MRGVSSSIDSISLARAVTIFALSAGAVFGIAACSKPSEPVSKAPFKLMEAKITDIQQAIVDKTLTTEQLVKLYLARIKAYNGTCVKEPDGILGVIETIPNAGQINAISTLNLRPETRKTLGFDDRKARSMTDASDADPSMPDALETAIALDKKFAETGKLVGPLHGVVIAVKDQYDTFDMRSTSGADVAYADDRAPDDATFIKKLREAGAIIIGKANLGEYASGIPRSSFGGTFCNPYDTERSPSGSSSGSGSAVAANMVTCAIAEETGSSVRGPARANNSVGLAPTQELVSRDGMIQQGINTRVGPICRTVEDVARVMGVIAGYDPKDELTVFAIGRTPSVPYESFTHQPDLKGVTIGVAREYMNKKLFNEVDAQSIELVEKGAADLQKLGATIVDPGPEGALFTSCLTKYGPELSNKIFAGKYPDLFPLDAKGAPKGDHITTLIEMAADPSKVPADYSLREMGPAQAVGQSKYSINHYLMERGDAAVKNNMDLIAKAKFHQDPQFPDRKLNRENQEKEVEYDMSKRMLLRFAVQTSIMQCMQEMKLDAVIYPTSNIPPQKLGAPIEPTINGRGNAWSFLGQQGFPAITVPAGFTTQVWDRVREPGTPVSQDATGKGTKLVGPIDAKLPVGMDIVAAPFGEPMLFKIASAYEAATKHRTPPAGYGSVEGEP
jgi:amidase